MFHMKHIQKIRRKSLIVRSAADLPSPARFERAAFRLGGERSILLSYGETVCASVCGGNAGFRKAYALLNGKGCGQEAGLRLPRQHTDYYDILAAACQALGGHS